MILGSTIQVFRGINRKLIFEAATDPKQRSCFPKMSSVFLSHRFCGRCSVFVPLGSRLGARVRLQQPSVLTRTQRRFIAGRSVFFRDQSKSKLWICGVGVGVALAVGLQYSKCDHKVGKPTDQFRGAIEVSRELLERIKVGTEVGQTVDSFLLRADHKSTCFYNVSDFRLRLELLDWWLGFLWMDLTFGVKVGSQ